MTLQLQRAIWEAKMCALTSAVQQAVSTARTVDMLLPQDCALAVLISAVTYMRTTSGFTAEDEERLFREALRATPERELAHVAGWKRV